jgi:hypothetical protein
MKNNLLRIGKGILLSLLLVVWFAPYIVLADSATATFDTSADQNITVSSGTAQLATPTDWYSPSWKYRKGIRIDHTKVTGDQTNFPVLVSQTDTDLRDVSNGGHVEQSNGADFIFTSADGKTVLPYEIEQYVNTTGAIVAYVNVPALSSSVDTTLYLYYGNATVSAPQNASTVWDSNYQAVLHLGEGPANNTEGHLDSTSNQNKATPFNFNMTSTSSTAATGKIGKADAFDGANDFLSLDAGATVGVPGVGTTQEGLSTDGTYLYVSSNSNIYKYSLDGTLIATSATIVGHIGGSEFYNGYLYVAQSVCPSTGTTANHHVYKYDTNLQLVAQYDIGADFTICAGAIAHYNGNFYVAESFWDNTHNDRIVKYDESFNKVATITLSHQCPNGIQGIAYIPPLNKFRILCHSTDYIDVDTDFSNASIQAGIAPFTLQDLAYSSGNTVLYNDRSGNSVRIITDPSFSLSPKSISETTAYTAQAWFKIDGGVGTRRMIFESTPNWAMSVELNTSNQLAYSIQTNGTNVTKTTNVIPTTGTWHHVALVYSENGYSKIYYDGAELTGYQGVPAGTLLAMNSINIGTYRVADTRYFNGEIDEFRLSNAVRSGSWITTEYANENDPSSFYTTTSQTVPFSTANPSIQSATPISFVSLSGFTENAAKNGGEITYQLSNDNGTTWYWYSNGWATTTNGYAESNTAADINARISTFPVGKGQLLFRAYLHSDGSQFVQLHSVSVAYSNSSGTGYVSGGGAPAVRHQSVVPSCNPGDRFSAATGLPCASSTQAPPTDAPAASRVVFTANLYKGARGAVVRDIQRYLNAHGFPVAATGAGSPGSETDYFGPATRAALAKFQRAHGILPATGGWGPKTRALVNSQ